MSNPVVLKARTAAILLLVLTAGLPLFAADGNPGAWFSSDPLGASYAAVEADISAVFNDAEGAGVPTALLMDKLQEGASKSVAPDRLVQALRAEAGRLTDGQAAITRARIRLAGTEEQTKVLKALSLLFVSGVQEATVDSLLAASSGRRDPSDLGDALNVLVQIRLSTGLTDSGVQVLGTALLKSALPRTSFQALPGVLFNAAARGMDDETAAAVLAGVLAAGGGILQMDDALQKKADADAATARAQGLHGRPATAPTTPASARSGGNAGNPPGQSGTPGNTDHSKKP